VQVDRGDGSEPQAVRAATLGAAASAVFLGLGDGLLATLNGRPVEGAEEPLVAGDVVVWRRVSSIHI
jgi:hypothetical protein